VLRTGIAGPANTRDPTINTVSNILTMLFRCQYSFMMQATSSVAFHKNTSGLAGPSGTAPLQARLVTERTGFSEQTNCFPAASFDGFFRLLRGMYSRFQNKRARELRAHLEGRAGERLRNAHKLHNTLLQKFHGLLLRFQAACSICRTRPEETDRDQKVIAVVEGWEVQNMCSFTEITSDLAQALGKVAKEFGSKNGARFRVVVEGSSRHLHPIIRREVYRISCEALRNAFRHAGARTIEAEILYSNSLRVRIRDDGKGIDAGMAKHARESGPNHYGLVAMHERAVGIGANLIVWSAPGVGSEIELIVPESIAYGASAKAN
jgi:signal transduction histidine kinase